MSENFSQIGCVQLICRPDIWQSCSPTMPPPPSRGLHNFCQESALFFPNFPSFYEYCIKISAKSVASSSFDNEMTMTMNF